MFYMLLHNKFAFLIFAMVSMRAQALKVKHWATVRFSEWVCEWVSKWVSVCEVSESELRKGKYKEEELFLSLLSLVHIQFRWETGLSKHTKYVDFGFILWPTHYCFGTVTQQTTHELLWIDKPIDWVKLIFIFSSTPFPCWKAHVWNLFYTRYTGCEMTSCRFIISQFCWSILKFVYGNGA